MSVNKQYIRYQIQNRKYSANAIEGIYLNEKGKECIEYIFGTGHAFGKKQADRFVAELVKHLNDNIHNLNILINNEQSNKSKI